MQKEKLKEFEHIVYQGKIGGDDVAIEIRLYMPNDNVGVLQFYRNFENGLPAFDSSYRFSLLEEPSGALKILAAQDQVIAERFNSLNLKIWSISENEMELEYGRIGKYNLNRLK